MSTTRDIPDNTSSTVSGSSIPTGNSSRWKLSRGPQQSSMTIKLVLLCSLVAIILQGINLQGSFSASINGQSLYSMSTDCRELFDLIKDAPGKATSDVSTDSTSTPPPDKTAKYTTSLAAHLQHASQTFDFPLPRILTGNGTSLVVMVLSRRGAFSVRQTIRETWAANQTNVYFVIGQGCDVPPKWRAKDDGGNPICAVANKVLDDTFFNMTLNHIEKENKIHQNLLEEQASNQDLLMMDAVDIYRNLPAKLKYAYPFVDHRLPESVEWVLKVDDDFYVRVEEFENLLKARKESERAKFKEEQRSFVSNLFGGNSEGTFQMKPTLIGGDIRTEHAAFVDGKWKEVPQWPSGKTYPAFPLGSNGHVVNRPIFHYVARYQKALFDYQGEDNSLGIWLSHPNAPTTQFVQTSRMTNAGDCRIPRLHVIGHDVKPAKMRVCYHMDMERAGKSLPEESTNALPRQSNFDMGRARRITRGY